MRRLHVKSIDIVEETVVSFSDNRQGPELFTEAVRAGLSLPLQLPGDIGIAYGPDAMRVRGQDWTINESGFLEPSCSRHLAHCPSSENQPPKTGSSDSLPRGQMAVTPVRTEPPSDQAAMAHFDTGDVGDRIPGSGSALQRNAEIWSAASVSPWMYPKAIHSIIHEFVELSEATLPLSNLYCNKCSLKGTVMGEPKDWRPVSFAQQRLWFLDELEPGNPAYNLPRVIRIRGTLNAGALGGAINALVTRHDGLRTVFRSSEGEPKQLVLPVMQVDLPVLDLTHLASDLREKEALRLAGEEARKPFDLHSGPLMRATLIRLGRETHILVLVMHHIITDGWSMSIFFQELTELYRASIDGRPASLPPLAVRYSDFVRWQRDYVSGEVLAGLTQHWKKALEGAETILELPTDRPWPLVQTGKGASEYFHIR